MHHVFVAGKIQAKLCCVRSAVSKCYLWFACQKLVKVCSGVVTLVELTVKNCSTVMSK